MGKVKQLSIENELPDVGSMYRDLMFEMTRSYIMNGSNLTREEFISQVALSLYVNEPDTDIRKTIDLLLNDDYAKELVCSGGDKFFTYLSDGELVEKDIEHEEHALKFYNVSYDVIVQPLIPILTKKTVYKRVTESVVATSFREAKEKVRERTFKEGKTTKTYKVVEDLVTETKEVRDPSNAE